MRKLLILNSVLFCEHFTSLKKNQEKILRRRQNFFPNFLKMRKLSVFFSKLSMIFVSAMQLIFIA